MNAIQPCQIAPAVFDQTAIDAGRGGLRANGQVMRFVGYLPIYAETQDEARMVGRSASADHR
jgi:DNA topoisomerase IA